MKCLLIPGIMMFTLPSFSQIHQNKRLTESLRGNKFKSSGIKILYDERPAEIDINLNFGSSGSYMGSSTIHAVFINRWFKTYTFNQKPLNGFINIPSGEMNHCAILGKPIGNLDGILLSDHISLTPLLRYMTDPIEDSQGFTFDPGSVQFLVSFDIYLE